MNTIPRKQAEDEGLKFYFTGKACTNGHISKRRVATRQCIDCGKLNHKKWRDKNRLPEIERCKKYRIENKEAVNRYRKEFYEKNKADLNKRCREYKNKNKELVKKGIKRWREENPLNGFIRESLKRMQTDWKGGRKKTEMLLGYSENDLKTHIEKQFLEGMSWGNRSDWHIDHIVPISHLLKNNVTDPRIINALSNLRPLWAKDNLSKGLNRDLLC